MKIIALLSVLLVTSSAFADSSSSSSSNASTSTSSTSTSSSSASSSSVSSGSSSSSSSSPTPCQTVAECVYDNVPPTVASCFSSTPLCTSDNQKQFSATAEQLADSALANAKCTGRNWKKKGPCNACYQAAKAPLANRFYAKLFKGLLAQATRIIETRRAAVCGALSK